MQVPFSPRILALIIIFVSALFDLALGVRVILNAQQRKVNQIFAFLCMTVGVFSASFFLLNLPGISSERVIWFYSYIFCLSFLPATIYHQVFHSLSNSRTERGAPTSRLLRWLKKFLYAFGAGLCLLAFRGNLFNLETSHTFAIPTLQYEFRWLAILNGLLILGGIAMVIRFALKTTDRGHRNRLVTAGASSASLAILFLSYFSLPIQLLPSSILSFLFLLMTLCLVCLAIAITSTPLYQISEWLRKYISYLFCAFVMGLTYTGVQIVLKRIFKGEGISFMEVMVSAIGSVLMAFLLLPRRFLIEKVADRLFFFERYLQAQKLEELKKRKIPSCQDKASLLQTLFCGLKESGFMTGCLILKASTKPFFRIVEEWGLPANAKGFFLKDDHVLIQHMKMQIEEDIHIDRMINRIMPDADRQMLKESLAFLQSDILFPIFRNQDRSLMGFISLGNVNIGTSAFGGRNHFWLRELMELSILMLKTILTQEQNNALTRYTGELVANEVQRNNEDFHEDKEGVRTWATVLMVDIRQFTTLSNHLEPQTVVKLVKEFRSIITKVVESNGGAVDKCVGDSLMGNFGIPILDDKSEPDKKAVLCAIAIIAEIERVNKENGWPHGHKISVGIGIASGEVIAGNIDWGRRSEYTVIGDTPCMAARLEGMAQDNQILLSPVTFSRLDRNNIEVLPWPPQKIDGFDEPVVVYELKGVVDPNGKKLSDDGNWDIAVNQ